MPRYKWITKDGINYCPPSDKLILPSKTYSFDQVDITIDKKGKLYSVYVREGYGWNGCGPGSSTILGISPVWNGRRVGYLDLSRRHAGLHMRSLKDLDGRVQELYFASMIHDALCKHSKKIIRMTSIRQKDIDRVFYNLAKESGFVAPRLYYKAIRLFQSSRRR